MKLTYYDKAYLRMLAGAFLLIATLPITLILVLYVLFVNGLGYIALKVEDFLFWFEEKIENLMF